MPKTKPKKVKRVNRNGNNKSRFSLFKILEAAKQEATGSKTSNYLVTTAATGVLFVIISLFVTILVPPEYWILAWIILSFVFALTFSPIRYGLEELIRQLFPGTDYDSHALVKRLNSISYSSLTLNDLSRLFFEEFAVSFDVPESAFVFIRLKTSPIIKTSDHFQNLQSLKKSEIELLMKNIGHQTLPIKNFKSSQANQLMKNYHIKVIVPLTNNYDVVGILLIGTKFKQHAYTTKDLKVLNAIAPKLGFAIKNAYAYERIQKKNTKLINQLKEANDKLRQANRQLRSDDKLKDEFVYVATHELKNPVTAMKGYLSLVQEGNYGSIPKKLQPAINQINISNQQLIGLLNNLLQIARAEAQRLEIKTKPVTICKVIDEVSTDLKPLMEQKSLLISHSCHNRAVTVMADKERLREIINNLVSNAIKYSNHGTIEISHEIEQDQLVTHIKDQGVGISPADQKKIFTRFFRVEEEAAKGIPGTGLGLFIVKQLIEKMGGQIWFESAIDKGSTFSFSLPLARTYALKTE